MHKRTPLALHEEVMLLALGNQKGTIVFGAWYPQAVGGAVLAELLLAARLRIVGQGRKQRVEVVAREPLGEELLDEWLERIAADRKQRTLAEWVQRIAGTRGLKGRIARGLVQRGILRCDEDRVLLLFRRKTYPELQPGPERELRERMRAAIFGDSDEVDARTIALISLCRGTGLLEVVFERRDLKRRKQRIERLIEGEASGAATRELVLATLVAISAAGSSAAILGA